MRAQAENAYASLINDIGNSKDIDHEKKLLILESLRDTLKDKGENLLYLECVQKMKEIDIKIAFSYK